MRFDVNILNRYLEEGRIMRQSHPTLPLWVYNYTLQTQYSGDWDSITLQCRGLILDNDGFVVARTFPKFFNYSEVQNQKTVPWNEGVHIQDKMDGSLITLFNYENQWIVASKGSFTSEQATAALSLIIRKYDLTLFNKDIIYAMEYISQWNRIVVNYGDVEKVTFLGAFTIVNELEWKYARNVFLLSGISEDDIVPSDYYSAFSEELLLKLQSQNIENKEGYILRFSPSNYRVKVKFEEYVRLHKIMTEVSTTSVWDMVANGISMEIVLQNVPDEFFNRIKEYEQELLAEYNQIEADARREFDLIFDSSIVERAHFAKLVTGNNDEYITKSKYAPILFRLYDGNSYSDIIWKMIKPAYRKL